MLTTKTASELRVGMTVRLSGRTPQRVTGIAEQHSPTFGSSFKVWLEHGAIVEWCSAGFKFKVEMADDTIVPAPATKEAIKVNFLLPDGLDEIWLSALFDAMRQGGQ